MSRTRESRAVEMAREARHASRAMQINRFFDQGEIWRDRYGVEHRITEMDTRYRLNVRRFLLRNAEAYWCEYIWGEFAFMEAFGLDGPEDGAGSSDEEDSTGVWPEDFARWIRTTELFKALERGNHHGDER